MHWPPPPAHRGQDELKLTVVACLANRYVLDIGQSQDWLGLQVALAPCLLGYGALAKMLHGDSRSVREGNHYWNWVENYVADDYVQAVKTGSGELTPISPLLAGRNDGKHS